MRHFLIIGLVAIAFGNTAQAQHIDATINPIGALFGNFSAAAELPITESFGVEPNVGLVFRNNGLGGIDYKGRGFSLGARGKYYFSPREDNDRFYLYAYTRFARTNFTLDDEDVYDNTRLSLGLGPGFKIVADNGLVFDVGFGIGRALLNDYNDDDFGLDFSSLTSIDLDGRLSIGYRIGN